MSSPSPSDGPAPPSSRKVSRFTKRGKLKNGTFILPGTGERIRRQITLRNPANFDGPAWQHSDESIGTGTFRSALDNSAAAAKRFGAYLRTPVAKDILKCSLAYLLGSCATFLPPIAGWLGAQDGKHLVATITVYFHPARSAGSMIEAAILGVAAFCYATFIGVSSMATSVLFDTQLNMLEVGHAVVLVIFCGGGLGFIGWFKQKFGSPLVNVACSLASLAIITILTKENAIVVGVFSNDKIVQVMKMVALGIAATSFVSLSVWPKSARAELRNTMIKATDLFGDMLNSITRGFLSGSESDLKSVSFSAASSRYQSVFPQLAKNLKEAKLEHYVLGTEDEYRIEKKLVNCMQRLAQSIGGLRSAATTQFTLLKEPGGGGTTPANRSFSQFQGFNSAAHRRFAMLTAIEEASEEGSGEEDVSPRDRPSLERVDTNGTTSSQGSFTMPTAKSPGEIFSRFITHLGPSMKSLAYTLSEILSELPFGPAPDYKIAINEHFGESLTDALSLFSVARAEALRTLYISKELDKDRSESIEADFEEVAASCGYFSFNLYDFGTEMQTFLAILEELKEHTEHKKHRSWKWLRFWNTWNTPKVCSLDPEQQPLLHYNRHTNPVSEMQQLTRDRLDTKYWSTVRKEDEDTKQTVYRKILHMLRILRRDDVRFALKVGIGASVYAMFAYIPATRPLYQHWRGEWGLVSYMLVCSMTIGASNTTGWSRFYGSLLGAIVAMAAWALTQGNPFALAFCGWAMSLACFYIMIAKGNGPLARFIMLTYNLSCLYAYSLSIKEVDDDDDEGGSTPWIMEIALHRVVAVFVGCLWGMIITRVIWPISARKKFKDGLSLLWLRMGLIWMRDPLSTLLEGEHQNSYMNLREEFALQKYVLQLNILRAAASNEFELRGPFPSKHYSRIMESTNKMLDAFHAMNVVIQKDLHASEGESVLLRYTAEERAHLCARISHLFQVLASSLKLEYPLTHNLPSTVHARDRLLAKIFKYRKIFSAENSEITVAKDEDYEMLYAYILVTGQLAEEIGKVEKEIEDLFGVMDEDLLKLQ